MYEYKYSVQKNKTCSDTNLLLKIAFNYINVKIFIIMKIDIDKT